MGVYFLYFWLFSCLRLYNSWIYVIFYGRHGGIFDFRLWIYLFFFELTNGALFFDETLHIFSLIFHTLICQFYALWFFIFRLIFLTKRNRSVLCIFPIFCPKLLEVLFGYFLIALSTCYLKFDIRFQNTFTFSDD